MAETVDVHDRLQFGLTEARNAGELILRYYQDADLAVELKSDQSPVTVADRGAEELLRKRIQETFPGDGILGEEFGETESQNGYRWILDPIDGTKSFVHGVPLFGTLIGLEYQGEMVMGICRFPALDEMVYAAQGGGTWWRVGNQDPVQTHVTDVSDLSQALFCFTEIEGWNEINRFDVFTRLSSESRITRGWGDCYGHALVATGRAEFIVDPLMSPWDAAALVPILQEAGGHFLDWKGQATINGGNGVSVNAALKEVLLDRLK
ncbi:MAG: histidinol-phosphatase [Planctomycetaceae bacterium]|nr:histidinol-phosphatase [Planctomycetaceae bacterium]